MCILCVPCAFSRLVTRRVSGNNAPLLLIKAFKHLCVVFVYSLCIQSSCDEEGFGKPCTSLPHKGVWASVCMFLSLACVFGCLVMGKVSGNHALVLLIKAFRLLCLVACKPASRAFVRLVTRG